ncbi:MAG: M48 family metalloprotease [Gallionellaceae bacterium]|nr:M48 family metalloprotease [Gallionellaceae bacterium]
MARAIALLVILLVAWPAWGADEPVAPYRDAAEAKPTLAEEDRVWAAGERGEQAFIKPGHVYPDPALNLYLQTVLDRLFPEFVGALRVQAANDSGLNAFALPQGAIFVNMGLLARLENEAQLATILAHEGSHFTHRHAYQNNQKAKSLSGFARTAGILTGGVGALLGDLAANSSMSGYSQDLEREADLQGFRRMAQAGYDVRESVKAFELLAEEVTVLDVKEPYFFANHPRLQERIESFNALIAGYDGPAGETGEDRYSEVTRSLREQWLRAQLSEGKPKSIIHVLANPAMLVRYPVHAPYYLGESYRLRGNTGDTEKAVAAWRQAIVKAPEFAPSYRALGVQAMKQRDWAQARALLSGYLRLAPDASDAAYIRNYLELVEEKLKS